MNEKEIAAVLCGLRLLQNAIEEHGEPPGGVMDGLTNGGKFSPLTVAQIDELCECLVDEAMPRTDLACTAVPSDGSDPRNATDDYLQELLHKLRAKVGERAVGGQT